MKGDLADTFNIVNIAIKLHLEWIFFPVQNPLHFNRNETTNMQSADSNQKDGV